MERKLLIALIWAVMFCVGHSQAQLEKAPDDWFHLDLADDNYPGVSSKKAHEQLLKGKKGEKVIVAVLDSGVDYDHEDLKEVMWVNAGEIAGNGIDDDGNGYIDDIHGWNFIGNKAGENVEHDNIEMTRTYALYRDKYKDADPDKLSKKERKEYETYKKYGEIIETKKSEIGPQLENLQFTIQLFDMMKASFDKEDVSGEELKNIKTSDELLKRAAQAFSAMMEETGFSFKELGEYFGELNDYLEGQIYHYDPDLDSRKIVGDDYRNPYETGYGNSNVEGPDAKHGTHVAGIIAASRNNGMGIDGIATNVEIMSVRVVPDGDERDKDVANAIRYAVDNGASIINMSFGKGESPRKEIVDKAVKYALKHDVLLVHAAGNDGSENQANNNFPNDRLKKPGLFGSRFAKNWIEVGANHWTMDENLPASFSNYSNEYVDVFAPGTEIYSTVPGDGYKNEQGTSMAAPVVSGVAAVLRSYFPELTAQQVKEILLTSSVKQKIKVVKPGTSEQVPFSQLSTSGGMVNAYNAIRMAQTVKGKKKKKKKSSYPRGSSGGKDTKDKKDVAVI